MPRPLETRKSVLGSKGLYVYVTRLPSLKAVRRSFYLSVRVLLQIRIGVRFASFLHRATIPLSRPWKLRRLKVVASNSMPFALRTEKTISRLRNWAKRLF
jgi:hypothetical protein